MRWASLTSRAATVVVAFVVLLVGLQTQVGRAASLNNRSLILSTSRAQLTNVDYNFSFIYPGPANVGSIEFEFCSNDPFIGTACTAPAGFDASSAVLALESGETGFTIHPNSTANRLVLSRPSVAVTPGAASYYFSGLTNPDTAQTYYIRLATFTSTDGTGPRVDQGGLAFSITPGVNLTTEVPPHLTFCVGTNMSGTDCNTISGNEIDFGVFSPSSTRTGSLKFGASTNASSGYTVTLNGTTLTSGNNVIDNLTTPTGSQTGVSQFGMNLRTNTTPPVGSDPVGPGVGSPTTDYNQPNQFTFRPGDVIAAATGTSDSRAFTASFVVNTGTAQAPGVYSSTIGLICLANF